MINVGISVMAVQGVSIWSSGLNQNVAFLVSLLRQSPQVGEIYLLNGGNIGELPDGMDVAIEDGVTLVQPADVTYKVNLVIEMGAQLHPEWLRHVRALGAKIVLFPVGNSYVHAAEGPMFGLGSGVVFDNNPWHEIWILPQHEVSARSMLMTLTRLPVHVMPHIWDPVYLAQQVAAVRDSGHAFGFTPHIAGEARRGWRAAIFEPNISVVKNCFIPMLVCEQAYRLDPDAISLMAVMNTFHMKEHPTFNAFAANLDLTKHHKATYEPRVGFAEVMGQSRMDVVVAHHWENGQNYAYYDALYGGYPLIHNSEYLRDAGQGFYYPHFAAGEGARALLHARAQDEGFWQDYKRSADAYLQTLSPREPANVAAFTQRLYLAAARSA